MYRYLTLLLVFCEIAAFAQTQQQTVDTTFKFDQRFTQCEKKWVVLPKKPSENQYLYGFVYIDSQAGFTFDLRGYFTIDHTNHYIDTQKTRTATIKYRIQPNWTKLALLPSSHFKDLSIAAEPDWVKLYYRYTDTVQHNYRMGFVYNAADDCATALIYLQKAYKVKSHLPGLEFEMAYAYNALNQPDQAISILEDAVKADPDNVMFYRELGYAYLKKKDAEKAIGYYTRGIEKCTVAQNEQKSEMAFNMASVYKRMNNADEYKNWMLKAKEWSAPSSNIYKAIVAQGF